MQTDGIKKSMQQWHTIMNKIVPEILFISSSILLFWKISTYKRREQITHLSLTITST